MKKSLFAFCFFLSCILFAAEPKVLEEIRGKVIGITDGDTLTLQTAKDPLIVRLEGIDAPERGQAFGTKSREALKTLVFLNEVTIQKTGVDKYKRTLGIVKFDGVNINAKMVKDGWAWHFKKYSSDDSLAKLETEARDAKRGLWADKEPIPPWDFREQKKDVPAASVPVPPIASKPKAKPKEPETETPKKETKLYWLNSQTGVRHNERCKHYNNTKKGRSCDATEGKACGICGG